MNRSSLAEKQLPQWEIEDIESMSPLQDQPGPSGFLVEDRPSINILAAIMGATQRPKRRVYTHTRSLFPQGSVGVPFRLEKPAKRIADFRDIRTSQHVTLQPSSTSEWHHIPGFVFNTLPTAEPISWSIEPSEGLSSFQFEPATEATPTPAEHLQNRYKALSSKRYSGSLTSDEILELNSLEEQLDELDAHDADLQTFIGRIDEGYDRLSRGLREINGILDQLLRR
jgi:hypothetical protein